MILSVPFGRVYDAQSAILFELLIEILCNIMHYIWVGLNWSLIFIRCRLGSIHCFRNRLFMVKVCFIMMNLTWILGLVAAIGIWRSCWRCPSFRWGRFSGFRGGRRVSSASLKCLIYWIRFFSLWQWFSLRSWSLLFICHRFGIWGSVWGWLRRDSLLISAILVKGMVW